MTYSQLDVTPTSVSRKLHILGTLTSCNPKSYVCLALVYADSSVNRETRGFCYVNRSSWCDKMMWSHELSHLHLYQTECPNRHNRHNKVEWLCHKLDQFLSFSFLANGLTPPSRSQGVFFFFLSPKDPACHS
jgi:hypothetical protein